MEKVIKTNYMNQEVFCGNNIEVLKGYPDNHFDSIVTDPPYGLSFMGKKWDYDVPSVEFWQEAFRVLKHGGHLLSFSGTRTYHRMVVNIEDAGFEIRDQIQWIYGSGFPKSHNISKAIDKMEGNEREVVGDNPNARPKLTGKQPTTMSGKYSWQPLTKGNSDWEGWGTALKPANEPICVARKPPEKGMSIAENVLKYGTGGINIDASRVGTTDKIASVEGGIKRRNKINQEMGFRKYENGFENQDKEAWEQNAQGRFPANVILTHHPECVCNETIEDWECVEGCPIKIMDEQSGILNKQDVGGASRFFYCAKASKSERNRGLDGFENKKPMYESHRPNYENTKGIETPYAGAGRTGNENRNNHPTVKPVKLMEYLVRMVTPPNGIVLDPFNGSGTTGVACKISGFNYVGIDMDEDYVKISQARINNYIEKPQDYQEDTPKNENPRINNEDKPQLNLF